MHIPMERCWCAWEVQKLEMRSYAELVQRVREQQTNLQLTATSTTDPDQKLSAESALTQWQTTLDNLVSSPPTGRVTIQVSQDVRAWANTSRDITVRAGDILVVPKRPSYVLVQGQVYGPTAVAYRPGKSARWYLTQAGGTTNMANKRATFVIRANGTVISNHSAELGVGRLPGRVVATRRHGCSSREGAGWTADLEDVVRQCAGLKLNYNQCHSGCGILRTCT